MDKPRTYWLFGAKLTILLDEVQTQARYDLIEASFPDGTETPLHLHSAYNEVMYVLEGEFTVYMECGETVMAAGQQILVPKNAPHVVAAFGNPINRALTIASPSGYARLIRTVGIPVTAASMPRIPSNDMGLFVQQSHELGDMILGSHGARPVLRKTK